MNLLFELFLTFAKIGAFTFGGAYAAVPLIRDVVLDYGWISEDMLTNIIAVAESTPGPIMVNLATYVGSTQAGALGSFIATSAVVLPSFVITILIMILLKKLLKNPVAQAVLEKAVGARRREKRKRRLSGLLIRSDGVPSLDSSGCLFSEAVDQDPDQGRDPDEADRRDAFFQHLPRAVIDQCKAGGDHYRRQIG